MARHAGGHVRIAIVEDDERVARFVQQALRAAGYSVQICPEADAALGLARSGQADLVLLDLVLPHRDGLDVLAELHSVAPHLPIIIVSALRDIDTRLAALRNGACDYLTKPFSVAELVERVRLRIAGQAQTTGEPVLRVRNIVLDRNRRRVDCGHGPVALTDHEYRVLEHLLRNAGRIVSRAELLSAVWGFAHDTSTNLVDVCVMRLRVKVGAETIETVRHAGYLIDDAPTATSSDTHLFSTS